MTHVRDMSIWVPRVDGGWGWIVVLGSFLIHVFADGIVYSFGILLNIFMTVSLFGFHFVPFTFNVA